MVAPEGLAIQQAVQVHVPAGKLAGVHEALGLGEGREADWQDFGKGVLHLFCVILNLFQDLLFSSFFVYYFTPAGESLSRGRLSAEHDSGPVHSVVTFPAFPA